MIFRPGTSVEIDHNGIWYPAVVTHLSRDSYGFIGCYRVAQTQPDAWPRGDDDRAWSSERWVLPDHVRAFPAPTPEVPR
jgi:hypothetical protein